jgi:methylmalonyl-CoA/ethylmalonyl-CoA epimerase
MDGDNMRNVPAPGRHGASLQALGDLVLSVDHIAIAVEDLGTGVCWYESLGFTLLERRVTEGEHSAMISAVLRAGRAIVVLLQGTSPRSQVSRFIDHFGPGVQHIALEVADLDLAVARVREVGGEVEARTLDEGIRQAFLRRDPGSGVRVELIERRGGSFTDASVRQLFLAFERQDLF